MDIRGLGYVTLLSSDLVQWRQYASQVLGMMVAGSDDDERLYLKMDERHHRILVEKSTENGFGACGWEVSGKAALEQAVSELERADVQVTRGTEAQARDRKVQELVHFSDPDGNRHELFWGPLQDFARFVSPVGVKGFVTFPGEGEKAIRRFEYGYNSAPQSLVGMWLLSGIASASSVIERRPSACSSARIFWSILSISIFLPLQAITTGIFEKRF